MIKVESYYLFDQNSSSDTIFKSDTVRTKSDTSVNLHPQTEAVPGYNQNNTRKNSILHIFFSSEKLQSFEDDLIIYGKNHVPGNLRPLYNSIVEKSFDYSLILIFVILILFFLANITAVLFILDFTIKNKNHRKKFEKIYGKMYEQVLLSYMFGEISWETLLVKLKRKDKRANRRILISILLNFKANFKGELEHFIPEIYKGLELYKDSYKLANSVKHYKKVKGIKELIHLYPQQAKGLVKRLINDKTDYLRAEAQTAYIRLNPNSPFKFFYSLEKPFTRWTQLSAFNLIRVHQLPVPSFSKFLRIKHVNIQNFSLKMITYFQQFEDVSEVIKMLGSENERTRFLTYEAINDLRLYDSCEFLKFKYWEETEKNRIAIIKAMRNIGTNNDFDFLEKVMKTEPVSMKTEACRSMFNMSPEGREKTLQINKSSVPEIELLIAHVTDLRN